MDRQIGNFLFRETSIKDVYIIEPKKYGDNRSEPKPSRYRNGKVHVRTDFLDY